MKANMFFVFVVSSSFYLFNFCCGSSDKNNSSSMCIDGQGFNNLRCCQKSCLRNEECSTSQDEGFTHKRFTLDKDEYEEENGNLIIVSGDLQKLHKTNFTSTDYAFGKNGSAIVCFPLIVSLESCDRSSFAEEEFKSLGRSRKIAIPSTKIPLQFRSYVISPDTKRMETCVIYTLSFYPPFIAISLSVIFLLLTLILTFTLKIIKYENNVALVGHMITFTIGDIFTLLWHLLIELRTYPMCKVVPFFMQFCYLSLHFWLNVHMLDINRALTAGKRFCKSFRRRIALYSLFPIGIPLIITLIAILAQILDLPVLNPLLMLTCWFMPDKSSSIILLYGPIAVSLLINLILYLHIVVHIVKTSKEVVFANKNVDKQIVTVSLKLFFVLGIFWTTEIIKFFMKSYLSFWDYLSYLIKLQGFFLSLVYLLNTNTLKILKIKCQSKCCKGKNKNTFNVSNLTESTVTVLSTSFKDLEK